MSLIPGKSGMGRGWGWEVPCPVRGRVHSRAVAQLLPTLKAGRLGPGPGSGIPHWRLPRRSEPPACAAVTSRRDSSVGSGSSHHSRAAPLRVTVPGAAGCSSLDLCGGSRSGWLRVAWAGEASGSARQAQVTYSLRELANCPSRNPANWRARFPARAIQAFRNKARTPSMWSAASCGSRSATPSRSRRTCVGEGPRRADSA